jgi:cytochrome P450
LAEWNPFSHVCVDNPFPIYRELRDEQPVYHNEKMGFYALSRFDDVLYGLLHPALFKSSHGITLEHLDSPDQLLNKDDPEHLEHRKIVARAFTVSAIGKLEPKIREIAARLLDQAGDRNVMDVLDDFSIQMPASIIADMVGLPHEHRAEFLEHAKRFNVAEETDDDPRPTEDAMAASLHVYELVTQIVAEAAKNPGDDVMGSLLKAHIPDFNGGTYQLREDQVATRVVELAGAGFETTAKQIGNAVVALAWYPEQRAELAADPSLMKNAVEEIVRWDPASHYVVRFIEEEVTLHGTTIPANSRVVLLTSSANHDERVFENPELLDIHRKIERHVGFAFGTHLCLGAALARMETKVALEELLARYPNYQLSGPIERGYAGNVRGLDRLPIILKPAA